MIDNRELVLTTIFVLLMLLIFVPHDSRADSLTEVGYNIGLR